MIQKILKQELRKKLESLKKHGYTRINSISGVDEGPNISIVYSFSRGKNLINLKTAAPKKKPEIETITDLYPGAILFERELSEMLGVKVIGNKFDRLFLPENWPKGKYPLRKEVFTKK